MYIWLGGYLIVVYCLVMHVIMTALPYSLNCHIIKGRPTALVFLGRFLT